MRGYEQRNVWNMNEIGQFLRTLWAMSAENAVVVAKTRKSKERATWAFFVTAPGEKDTPIVVGRSFNPRCFKSLKKNTRLCKCDYFSSGRAWMASEIFVKVSFEADREGRHILLFPDNAPCHPNQLIDCFWNMKMAFLSKRQLRPRNLLMLKLSNFGKWKERENLCLQQDRQT